MAAPQREWPSVPELDTTAQVDFIICCDLNGTVKSSDGTVKSHWTAECVWSTLSCCTCMQLALGSKCRRWLRLCGDRGTGWLWVAPMSERGVKLRCVGASAATRNLVPLGCHHARRVITIHIYLYTMIQFWLISCSFSRWSARDEALSRVPDLQSPVLYRYCIQPRSAPTQPRRFPTLGRSALWRHRHSFALPGGCVVSHIVIDLIAHTHTHTEPSFIHAVLRLGHKKYGCTSKRVVEHSVAIVPSAYVSAWVEWNIPEAHRRHALAMHLESAIV